MVMLRVRNTVQATSEEMESVYNLQLSMPNSYLQALKVLRNYKN